MEYTRESIRLFAQSYKLITVYKGVLDNEVGRKLCQLLDLLAETDDPDMRLIDVYCQFFASLAKVRADVSLPAYLIEQVLLDYNTFTKNPVAASNYISDAILTDLECLQAICTIKAEPLRDYLRSLYILTAHEEYLPLVSRLPLFFSEASDLDKVGKDDGSSQTWCLIYKSLIFALEKREAFVGMLPRLRKFHETAGAGLFCRYKAAYFDGEVKALPPSYYPKDNEFFDYNGICVKVIENTARFLVHGERHNVVLAGPSCLGKTTTLRLLPEQFIKAGYRYLELCADAEWTLASWQKLLDFLKKQAESNLKIVLAILRLGTSANTTTKTNSFQLLPENFDQRLKVFSNKYRYNLPDNCLIYASYDGTLAMLANQLPLLHRYFQLPLEFKLPNREEYLASVYAFAKLADFDVNEPKLTEAALTYAKQKQAYDLDIARAFIEVWRCMQNDEMTLTYDKVQVKQPHFALPQQVAVETEADTDCQVQNVEYADNVMRSENESELDATSIDDPIEQSEKTVEE